MTKQGTPSWYMLAVVGRDRPGIEARVAQHEIDHLDGLLFLDRLVSRRSDLFRRKLA